MDKQQALKLFYSADFEEEIAARLIQLAFADNGSVAVKAIEMLREIPRPTLSVDLQAVPREVLIEAERKAEAWLNEMVERETGVVQ